MVIDWWTVILILSHNVYFGLRTLVLTLQYVYQQWYLDTWSAPKVVWEKTLLICYCDFFFFPSAVLYLTALVRSGTLSKKFVLKYAMYDIPHFIGSEPLLSRMTMKLSVS